jgi:hypothetical protein
VVLYVTAKTKDGKEFYKDQRIYMPVPQQMGRGDKMGRGPYEKSGILSDTSLPPLKTTREMFQIPVYTESTKDDKLVRTIIANDFTVDVKVMYLPYGKKDDPGNTQEWFAVTKNLSIAKGGK